MASKKVQRNGNLTRLYGINLETWQFICDFYGNRCLKCGAEGDIFFLTPDHVYPKVLGGADVIKNYQPLCGRCNSVKAGSFADFRFDKGRRMAQEAERLRQSRSIQLSMYIPPIAQKHTETTPPIINYDFEYIFSPERKAEVDCLKREIDFLTKHDYYVEPELSKEARFRMFNRIEKIMTKGERFEAVRLYDGKIGAYGLELEIRKTIESVLHPLERRVLTEIWEEILRDWSGERIKPNTSYNQYQQCI